jgi:hypothetical protein
MKPINTFFLFLLGISITLFVVGCSNNQVQSSQNQPIVSDQSANPTPAVDGQNGISNPGSPPSGGYNNFNNTVNREAMRQSSIAACNGMNENDSCQLNFGNRTITGTCRNLNNTLSCAPAGGRMRGSGNYTRTGNYTRYQGSG